MMVRLLYASRCNTSGSDAIGTEVIEAILRRSRENNTRQGITGLLCHSGDVFMQVLEGGRDAVNTLYGAISRDPRHREVTLLHYEEITERRFGGWTMGQVNLSRINPSVLLKYSARPELNPFVVSGRVSLALLDEMIATASIVGRGG